jgi:sugar lactone lactonase YvrE
MARLRRTQRVGILLMALAGLTYAAPSFAQSVFTQKPDDPGAAYFTPENFQCKGDGVADDADALQNAVNHARGGILFVPEGRYRLGKTVVVPTGTRLIGFGKNRPLFFLAPNTPGFQEPGRGWPFGDGKYMLHFAQSRQADGTVVDASELDFYSALSNIDFEVGEGNPAAVCIRFKVAQHSFVSHANFKLGSALAALEDIGNQSSNLRISGGKHGIITTRTSPNWQFLLMDSTFENQSVSGVKTKDVGFTFIRCNFANMPIAIDVPDDESDQIYGQDLRFDNISKAAVDLGDPNHFKMQLTLVNSACTDVPHFLGNALQKLEAPGKHYVVDNLSAGLEIGSDGREVGVVTRHQEHALQTPAPVVASDIPPLPPMEEWFNVRNLPAGVDFQTAVNQHRVLYFPTGTWRSDTPVTLRPDSVLIGFHCRGTSIASIVAPKGGAPFVSGLNVGYTHWMAGEKSGMDDIHFSASGAGRGRGGAPDAAPGTAPAGESTHMLVDNGGGGIFRNLWIESGPGGLRVENTSTPAKFYQISNEHHARVEVTLKNVQNWVFHCMQTEEEQGNQSTYGFDIQDCKDVLFANTYMYRVSRTAQPVTYAIKVRNSDNIVFDNMHIFSQTRLPFDNAVLEENSGTIVRANNFTHLVVGKSMKPGAPLPLPAAFPPAAKLEKLADGFSNATSLTADDAGRIYFTDAVNQRIYRWNAADKKADLLDTISGNIHPQVMGFVKPNTLLVAAFAPGARQVGGIGALNINGGVTQALTEVDTPKPGTALLMPVGIHNRMDIMQEYINHRGYQYRPNSNTSIIRVIDDEHRSYFYAPDSNVALMAGGTGRPIMQASQLAIVEPGQSFLMTSEDDCRTWNATLTKDLKLTSKLFADRGGNAVVADAAGNVYIAGDQVFVYNKDGKQIGILEVPERPTGLAFGGPDKKTLFIGARTGLYAIPTAAAGK